MTLQEFNAKYRTTLDPQAIAEAARIKAVFDNYRFDKKSDKVIQRTTYWKALLKTLEKSINENTKIGLGKSYDLSDFDIVKFVREFEDIMSESHKKSSDKRERKPFEGMNFEAMIKEIKTATSEYDKPLFSVWANKITNNKISYEDLKTVTDESVRRIETQESFTHGTPDRDDIANVVYAHEAMFRVCQSRGFWWKAFHLYQNYKEHQYLDALSQRISTYIERNYPIENISDSMADSVMGDAYKKADNILTFENNERIMEKIQKQKEITDAKNREISSVADQLQPTLDDPTFKNELTDSIVKELPKCRWTANIQKTVLNSAITGALINEAKNANKNFDIGIIMGNDPKSQMLSNVKAVFAKAYSLASSLGYMDTSDQLLAAQKITDVVMKKASPAALQPEEYAAFTNGYVLNNPAEFEEITGMNGTEPVFETAKSEFFKENIQINDLDSKKEEIVPPVSEPPVIKDPEIIK